MAPELRWGERTYVMGILNVTPDSFSGDGLAQADRTIDEIVAAAVTQAHAFVEAGAEILDVGAESTRPRTAYGDHPEVDATTEAALAVPVVGALVEALGDRAIVSIDTSNATRAPPMRPRRPMRTWCSCTTPTRSTIRPACSTRS